MSMLINELSGKNLFKLPAGRHKDGLGLSLLVSKDGRSRSWTLRAKTAAGEEINRGLGALKKFTLEAARARRDKMLAIAAANPEQPMPSAPIAKKMPTFLERAREVIPVQTASAKNVAREIYKWERSLLHYAKPLHDKPVDTIEAEDVTAVLAPIWLKKAPTARAVRKHIAKVFSSCKADRLIAFNPAALEDNLEHKLARQKHKVRHHPAMPHADVAAYVAMLEAKGTLTALALAFAILTCARSEMTFIARWSDIDSDHVWTADAKNGLFSRVPLSAKAQDILHRAKAFRARGDGDTYVFPGKQDGHLSHNAMLKLLKQTHRHLTVHGFRASFKSWGMKFKIDSDTVEYCLHHIEGSRTEQAYMREECLEARRDVLEQWAAYVTPRKAGKLRLAA
jgi:hypothetical protein